MTAKPIAFRRRAARAGLATLLLMAGAARADLAFDTDFDTDGRAIVDFAGNLDGARAVAAQADGRIVLTGIARQPAVTDGPVYSFVGVARLLADGSPDPDFDADGRLTLLPGGTPAEEFAGGDGRAILVQSDQRIVVAGAWSPGGDDPGQLFVVRLEPDGSLDTGFGTDGVVLLALPDLEGPVAEAVAIQSDGSLVIAGSGDAPAGLEAFLLRLTPAGTLDPAFATAGVRRITNPDPNGLDFGLRALEVLPDDSILAAGGGGDVLIARFAADGAPDPAFGTGGFTYLELGPVLGGEGVTLDDSFGFARQSSGRIVVAASRGSTSAGRSEGVLVGVTPAGALDTGFGTGGIVLVPTTRESSGLFDVVALADDSLVTAGFGAPAAQVSPGGTVQFPRGIFASSANNAFIVGIATLPGGRVVLAGQQAGITGPGDSGDFVAIVLAATAISDEADTTPDPFTFVDVAAPVAPDSEQVSAAVTITGINAPAPVSVTGGEYQIRNPDGSSAAFTSAAGVVQAGQSIRVRHVTPLAAGAVTDTVLTVGGVSDTFSSTNRVADVDAFDLGPDETGVPLFTFRQSATITVSGLGVGVTAPIGVTGDATSRYSIGCNGVFRATNSTVTNGQQVCVRHISARTGDADVTTTLFIGGASDSFTSRTLATDATPDAFAFPAQPGVAIEALVTSAAVTITGLGAGVDALVEVANGQFSVGCTGSFQVNLGTVRNGQTICVRHTSAGEPLAEVTTTLSVGDVSATFTSTTGSFDLLPDRFDFVDQTGVELVAPVASAPVTITGLTGPAQVTVTGESGDEVSVGCTGTFTATPGRITSGQTLCVRHTSSGASEGQVTSSVQVGGRIATFASTTRVADLVPDAFAFEPRDAAALDTPVRSAPVTITGIDAPAPISVVSGGYAINCTEPFVTVPGVIRPGETVCVVVFSANADGETETVRLAIGPPGNLVTADFAVTTGDTTPDAFDFVDRANVRQATLVTADPVTITGLTAPALITIDLSGEYSVGCTGTYTQADGLVENGQQVCLRHASGPGLNDTVETTLRVGGSWSCPTGFLALIQGRAVCVNASGAFLSVPTRASPPTVAATFRSTTSGDSFPGSSAIDPWTLVALLPLLGLRRRRAAGTVSR